MSNQKNDLSAAKEAAEFGFYVFTQHNEKFKVLNGKDFSPNEIR